MSMRDLFFKLKHTGIKGDISTFSKACKSREITYCDRIYKQLVQQVRHKHREIEFGSTELVLQKTKNKWQD